MRRGGYRYGGAGGYGGEASGRHDGRSGGGPPQGDGGRGYHHPPQPHNIPTWGEDTRRGRYRDGAGPGQSVNRFILVILLLIQFLNHAKFHNHFQTCHTSETKDKLLQEEEAR